MDTTQDHGNRLFLVKKFIRLKSSKYLRTHPQRLLDILIKESIFASARKWTFFGEEYKQTILKYETFNFLFFGTL